MQSSSANSPARHQPSYAEKSKILHYLLVMTLILDSIGYGLNELLNTEAVINIIINFINYFFKDWLNTENINFFANCIIALYYYMTILILMRGITSRVGGSKAKTETSLTFLLIILIYISFKQHGYIKDVASDNPLYIDLSSVILFFASYYAATLARDEKGQGSDIYNIVSVTSMVIFVYWCLNKVVNMFDTYHLMDLFIEASKDHNFLITIPISILVSITNVFDYSYYFLTPLIYEDQSPAIGMASIGQLAILVALIITAPSKLKASSFFSAIIVYSLNYLSILPLLIFFMPRLIIVTIVSNLVFMITSNIIGLYTSQALFLFHDSILNVTNNGELPISIVPYHFVTLDESPSIILIPIVSSFIVALTLSLLLITKKQAKEEKQKKAHKEKKKLDRIENWKKYQQMKKR